MSGALTSSPVESFLADADAAALRADRVAAAFVHHLGGVTLAGLPEPAHFAWRDIARLLKCDPAKSLPPRAIATIAAWPAARIATLVAHMRTVHAALCQAENDALNEAIYAEISRAYS